MSRLGFRASPANCTACSNPCSANTTPPVSAAKTPCIPWGMNPPPAVKLLPWNDVVAMTPMASRGTAAFQMTTMELLSDMNLAPARFMPVNKIISTMATMTPRALSRPWLGPPSCSNGKCLSTQLTELT